MDERTELELETRYRPHKTTATIVAADRMPHDTGRHLPTYRTHHTQVSVWRPMMKRKTLGWFVRFGSWLNFFLSGRW